MAGMRGMNLLGCLVVGTLAAIGGGTTRDLLLGQTPVFWLEEVSLVSLRAACKLWQQHNPLFCLTYGKSRNNIFLNTLKSNSESLSQLSLRIQ